MKNLAILLVLTSLGISACKMTSVTFNYLGPAAIDIPLSIKSLVVVDHSAPKDELVDIIEGGLTGEGIGQDVEAVLNLINGINEIAQQSNRYSLVREPQRYGKGKLLENIPEAMDLSLIKKIGRKHNADAVLAIDKFDSDFIVTSARVEYKEDDNVSEETRKKKAYEAKGVATVFAYIRLYETSSGNILDEIKLKEVFSWRTYGENADDAVKALLRKQLAVNQVSYRSGLTYGRRIAPNTIRVTRQLYKKPTKNPYFSRGVRKAEVADWEGAIADWELAARHGQKEKVRQRAAFNIAVSYEVLGDLLKAQEWAQKAHIDYGEKRAVDYYNTLTWRVEAEEALRRQMGEIEETRP